MTWWTRFFGATAFLVALTLFCVPAYSQLAPGGHDPSKVARQYRVSLNDPRWKTAASYIISNYDYQLPWNIHYYLTVKLLRQHPPKATKAEDDYDSIAIFVTGGDIYADQNQQVRDIKRIDLFECVSTPDHGFKQISGWAHDQSIPLNFLAETNVHYKINPVVLYTNETRMSGTFPCAYLNAGDSYFFPAKGIPVRQITRERARQLAPGAKN